MKNKLLKWQTLILSATLACALLTGCGGANKINAPFESSYCAGKDLDDMVSELQEAGFTNIQTEAQESAVSFNANNVISVKIGSNTMYNTSNSWKSDVPIVIKYYEYLGDAISEPTPEPTPEPTEEVTYTADADSIRHLVVDKFQFDYDNLEVSYDDFDEAFVVSYLPADGMTENFV